MKRQHALYIALTAAGLILTMPPFKLGPISTVVLIPFILFLEKANFKESILGGFVLGLIWAGGTVYWIGWATLPGVFGVFFVIACTVTIYSGFQNRVLQIWTSAAYWTVPFLWTAFEILAGRGPLAFPWNSLAHSLTYQPILIQYASITGGYGVTFWIVLMNVLFLDLYQFGKNNRKRFLRSLISILILFSLPLLFGTLSINRAVPDEGADIRVSLVQGNVDPYIRWTPDFVDSNFTIYHNMSHEASQENPDLIVWPETAAPCYLRQRIQYLKPIRALADSLKTPLLIGSLDYHWLDSERVQTFNSAFLIKPGYWTLDYYHKQHLVPFSERVPFADELPFIVDFSKRFTMDIGNFTPGDSLTVFSLPIRNGKDRIPFSVLICYDSVFPETVRKFVEAGAQFVVVITNDGWFGNTSGPYQHAQIARLRAIENGIWIIRCANTGISEIIDPFGRVISKTEYNEAAVLTGTIRPLGSQKTFFTRYGRLIFSLFLLCAGLILLLGFLFNLSTKNKYHKNAEFLNVLSKIEF